MKENISARIVARAATTIATVIAAIAIVATIFAPSTSRAESADATALTITPPFFELNVNPGDAWASSIKVINTNAGDLPVHASVMGFAPTDEAGHGTFIDPATFAGDADALANWITLSNPSIIIPRGGAVDVPFSIIVPRGAAPGGHYAAILIGTAGGGINDPSSHVGVTSYISALIFIRVSGDIKEEGSIREFSTDYGSYQDPNVNFTLRFANTGNVHVRPQGEIEIYNAFGKERGKIDINQTGNLGYVLPSSTRRFDLSWHGDQSLLDIGEYTAVVTLSYGEDGKKSVSETTTFWVLPLGKIAEILFGVLAAGSIFVFIMRRSVRKMFEREMANYGSIKPVPRPEVLGKLNKSNKPAQPGVVDLRNRND